MKIKSLKVQNHYLFKDNEIKFFNENNEMLKTVVLAGINGSGKTTFLKAIVNVLTDKNNQEDTKVMLDIDENEEVYLKNLFNVVIENDKYFNISKPTLYRFEPSSLNYGEKEKPRLVFLPTEINFSNLEVKTRNYKSENNFYCLIDQNIINDVPSYLVSLVNTEIFKYEDLPIKEAIKKICDEINSIFNLLDMDIEMIGVNKNSDNMPLFKNKFGIEFDINSLSSGEKQLFLRAMTLKMLDINNSVILIDEPEISLHPKWQQKIVKVYEGIGENNQIIIATHSPHIVSSVKSESLKLLVKADNGIEILQGEEINGSYGYPVERVLTELMGLETPRDSEVQNMIKTLQNLVRDNKYETVEFKALYSEVKGLLGSLDEDIILLDMGIVRRKGETNAKNKQSS
ncbi:MAG: AAA family ATPase [Fusobacteriaceae bacterium]|nr:AAA family ATPase [Fusobacteriaceae bacterium]MBP6468215.1 AAA family ATPase [Fusobacteriaceae bacterium]MBU9918578.1 AAA family ATPase [Fusobacteriaceae bacterium]